MLCTKCNAELLHDDMFCGDCGTPVPQQSNIASATVGMSCSKCGQPMEMDDAFCGDCGTPFTPPQMPQAAPMQPQPAYQPPPQLTQPPLQPEPPEPIYQPAPQTVQPTPAPVMSAPDTKIPLVFIIDTSQPTTSYLDELNKEINGFKAVMSADGQTSPVLEVAVIQFGERHSLFQDFINIQHMNPVRFAPSPIPNAAFDPPIREALRLVKDYSGKQVPKHKPWIVLISGSSPADDMSSVANEIKNAQGYDALRFIALGVDKCNFEALNRLTDVVFRQDGTNFASFFNWLCGCARAIGKTPIGQKPQLPNLKGNVYRDK